MSKHSFTRFYSLKSGIFFLNVFSVLFCGNVSAQIQLDGTPLANSVSQMPVERHSPGGYFDTVRDRFGNKFLLAQIAADDAIRNKANSRVAAPLASSSAFSAIHLYSVTTCPSNFFNIYLEDSCGMDLWASNPTQLARLNVLVQVLCDLSNFIKSPCSSTGQKVNIWVRGGLTSGLGVATPFFNIPNAPSASGITDNTEWLTINSGKDAFTNIAIPLATSGGGITGSGPGTVFFHGSIALNFSPGVNWNTDAIPSSAPPAGVYDLYTVILHEMMHTLGFCTLIDYNGRSVFDEYNVPPAPARMQYYSRYDQHLETSSSSSSTVPLIVSSLPGCDMYQCGFNSAAAATASTILSPESPSLCPDGFNSGAETSNTVCSLAIRYSGSAGTVPVYTPACFERGGSLSHFDDQCYTPLPSPSNEEYFVMSNGAPATALGGYNCTSNPGIIKRFPTPEERAVLCDIGYATDTAFGVPGTLTGTSATVYAGLSGPNLNHHSYGGSPCPGRRVVGFNDGISATNSYSFYATTGTGIDINAGTSGGSILDNDLENGVSISTAGGSFSCLEVVTGTGTLSVGGTIYPTVSGTAATTVTYTAGASDFGVQLLRYIPVSSTGVEGNITYLYVFVGDAECIPTACDLISNGTFENVTAGSSGIGIPNERCWLQINFDPALYATDASSTVWAIPGYGYFHTCTLHPFSPPSNHHFVGFLAENYGSGTWGSSSIQTQLSSPLDSGSQYVISFWGLLSSSTPAHYPGISNSPGHIQFAVGNTYPLIGGGFGSEVPAGYMPAGFSNIAEFVNGDSISPDYSWHYYTRTITYTGAAGAASTLFIEGAPWNDTPLTLDSLKVLALDDISIVPISVGCSFSIQGPICSGATPFDLNAITSPSIPGGSFTWLTTPVTDSIPDTSHSNIFNPADAYNASMAIGGNGSVQLAYTYTVSGCVRTVFTEVRIIPGPPVAGTSTLCPGAFVTLSDSLAGGIWSSSNTGVATVGSATGIVTGVSAGTAFITYTAGIGCMAAMAITVNPCTTGLTPLNGDSKISVYPNPVHEELTIEDMSNATARLLNVTGECLQITNLQKGKNTISMREFIPGVYTLELTGADGIKTRTKVVKE